MHPLCGSFRLRMLAFQPNDIIANDSCFFLRFGFVLLQPQTILSAFLQLCPKLSGTQAAFFTCLLQLAAFFLCLPDCRFIFPNPAAVILCRLTGSIRHLL